MRQESAEIGAKNCCCRKCRKLRLKFVGVAQKPQNGNFVVKNDNRKVKGKYKLLKNTNLHRNKGLFGGLIMSKGKYKLLLTILKSRKSDRSSTHKRSQTAF